MLYYPPWWGFYRGEIRVIGVREHRKHPGSWVPILPVCPIGYNRKMRTQISRAFFIGMLVVLMLAVTSPAQPVQAAASDGYDLIAAVNTLRQSKGVAPLAVDGSLMGSAQSHTDYQASMGSWTHTGPGGSTPTSRAVAAGYGGGASVKVLGNFTYFTLNVGYMTAKAGTNPQAGRQKSDSGWADGRRGRADCTAPANPA